MGNPFTCSTLNGSGVLLFFLLFGWIILSVGGYLLINYFGRTSTNTNFNTLLSILIIFNVFFLVFGIIINSYYSPCGGNLFAFLSIVVNGYILYALFTNKWSIIDQTYSQV